MKNQGQMQKMKCEILQKRNQQEEMMRMREKEHGEKMKTLNSDHQPYIEEIKSKTEKYKYVHEKERKKIYILN